MDVLVGSSSSAAATSSLVLNQNDAVRGGLNGAGSSDSFSSTSSSSIGAPDDSADNEDDKADVTDSEEVQSEFNARGLMMTSLGSMNSLEDSLPIKRGLSNYFSGKSKSFASLSDVVTTASTVKEIEKKDNPINKRRRVLIASKWHRNSLSSSFYNNANPKSMPLLLASLNEDDEEEEETQQELSSSDEKEPSMIRTPRLVDRGLKKSGFKSMSCYCLSDLQGHDEH